MSRIIFPLLLLAAATLNAVAQGNLDLYDSEIALRLYDRSGIAQSVRFRSALALRDRHVIDSVCAVMIANIDDMRLDAIDTSADRDLLKHLYGGFMGMSVASALSSAEGRSEIEDTRSSVLADLRRLRDSLSKRGSLNRTETWQLYDLYLNYSAQHVLPSLWFAQLQYHPTFGLMEALKDQFWFYDILMMGGFQIPLFTAWRYDSTQTEDWLMPAFEITPVVTRSMIDGIGKLDPWQQKLYASDIKALTTILTIGMREEVALVIVNNG